MEPRYFHVSNQAQLHRALDNIGSIILDPERPIQIVVRDVRREKTGDQRKLFHAIASDIGLEMGEPAARVKTAIKEDFYGIDTFEIRGVQYVGVQSSEESDRPEYSRLIDFAYAWAAEHGILIQDRRKID